MIRETKDGVLINLFVQPKSAKNEIIGPHNGALKIKITAPPTDGKANQEIIEVLSDMLDVPKRQIHLVKGDINRNKTVLIQGISAQFAKQCLGIE